MAALHSRVGAFQTVTSLIYMYTLLTYLHVHVELSLVKIQCTCTIFNHVKDVYIIAVFLVSWQESLPSAAPDIQIAAGKSVGVMVTQSLVPAHIFLSSFLPLIIRLVNSRDPCTCVYSP